MKLTYRIRVQRGWGDWVSEDRTPEQIIKEIADLRKLTNGLPAFRVTKPGDRVPVSYSGNVFEMVTVQAAIKDTE